MYNSKKFAICILFSDYTNKLNTWLNCFFTGSEGAGEPLLFIRVCAYTHTHKCIFPKVSATFDKQFHTVLSLSGLTKFRELFKTTLRRRIT